MFDIASRPVLLPSFVLGLVSVAAGQATWQLAYPAQSPAASSDLPAAFDEARGEGILLKNFVGWRWDGSTWTQMSGNAPSIGFSKNLVYDAARQVVMLWGITSSGAGPQMWEWNGTSWQQRLGTTPSPAGAACAYDRARGVMVVFGGGNSMSTTHDSTWEWDGVTWSNPSPAQRPLARHDAKMAFDPNTQRVLLFGGLDANLNDLTDTWSWDGSTWQRHFPATPPFPRQRATMVADLDRARVVLHGGSTYDFQTWEWDGAEWHASIPGSPGAWLGMSGFYDTVRRETVLFGGTTSTSTVGSTDATWRYRTPNAATATSFGAGCAGSLGVPVLENVPYRLPWLGDTTWTSVNVAPGEPTAVFVTGFAQSPVPVPLAAIGMPGCDLLVQLDDIAILPPTDGVATWSLSIPNDTSLAGVSLHQQAFPFDASANANGIIASNGLTLTLGIR